MSLSVYIAVVHQEAQSAYGVTFPDLDGCFASAPTLEKALVEAEEALALYLDGLRANGEEIPEPLSLQKIQQGMEKQTGHALFLMEAPEGPARKVLISLPADLLSRMDRYAKREGTTRSGLVARAARALMRRNPVP